MDPSETLIEAISVAVAPAQPDLCGITGILCYGGGIFLQAIEGGRMAGERAVWAHPERRATQGRGAAALRGNLERRFGGWTMGQVNLSKINQSMSAQVLRKKPELDPYAVSGKVSLALLEELMATACDHCGRV
jgi:hypothetical protein